MVNPPPAVGLPSSWRVELPEFEGPLDLLLHLIRVNEVEITDIPVALICHQFHEYLELMEELDLDIAAEFVYTAALLVHLKSKLLLPQPKKLDGSPDEEDPRADLVRRLIEYQQMKNAAQTLAEVDTVRAGMWSRGSQEKIEPDADDGLVDVSLYDLMRSLRQVLDRFSSEHPEPLHLASETYSVRSQIERFLGRLSQSRPRQLLDELAGLSCRGEAIAAFLAILEMARLSLVRVHQTSGGDILLYRTTRKIDRNVLETIE